MYRRMGSKGRFSNIENAERFIKSLDSVCHEPKFYEHIVRKYGREEAERMILSDNDGRVNMILLDEADVYGVGENLSPTQLRKTIRQCVFPDR